MSVDDALRSAMIAALPGVHPWGDVVDAVLALPELEAWVERRARERAAATLADVLAEECRNVHPAVRDALADRADALAPPDGGWAWRRTATGWASDAPAADDQAGQR